MTDRNDRSTERRPAEGVRIIGAEEAQKALDAGQAAGRRADDELRYGDVPPAPAGPRPPHRFPLPDSVDPAVAVPRPPIASRRPESPAVTRTPLAATGTTVAGTAATDTAATTTDGSATSGGAATAGPVDGGGLIDPGVVDAAGSAPGSGAVSRWPGAATPAASAAAGPASSGQGSAGQGSSGQGSSGQGSSGQGSSDPAPDGSRSEAAWSDAAWSDPAWSDPAWSDPAWVGQGAEAEGWTAPQALPASDGVSHVDVSAGEPDWPWSRSVGEDRDPARSTFGAPNDEVEPTGPLPALGGSSVPPWTQAESYSMRRHWADEDDASTGGEPDPVAAAGGAGFAGEGDATSGDTGSDDTGTGAPGGRPGSGSLFDPAPARSAVGDAGSDSLEADATATLQSPTPEPSVSGATRASSWNLGERSSPWADTPSPETGEGASSRVADPPGASSRDYPAPAGAGVGAEEGPAPDLAPPESGITVTGSHVLPHWTEPSDGVPASILGPDRDDGDPAGWDALGTGGARWRSGHDDWEDAGADAGFFSDEDQQGPRLGALDTERSDQSDIYSFDEAFQQLEEERSGAHPIVDLSDQEEEPMAVDRASVATRVRSGGRRGATSVRAQPGATRARTAPGRGPGLAGRRGSVGRPGQPAGAGGEADLRGRLVVGVGLLALLVVAYAIGARALVVLAAVIVLLCAAEAYRILQRCGFRPATLLGLTATGGLMLAAYWRGEAAVPLVVALAFAATMVWYLLGIVEARPLANVAVTAMTFLWVGLLGSFAALMLRAPHGKGLFLGAVVVTVASDIASYFAGKQWGQRPLAPAISPGKTVEGLLAGVAAAIVVGLFVGRLVTPWGGFKHGFLLGVVVAVVAPIGDLFESLIKRDLEVKDSGTVLGGHGGLLDRFDAVLLVLPAAYYLADYLHLVR